MASEKALQVTLDDLYRTLQQGFRPGSTEYDAAEARVASLALTVPARRYREMAETAYRKFPLPERATETTGAPTNPMVRTCPLGILALFEDIYSPLAQEYIRSLGYEPPKPEDALL